MALANTKYRTEAPHNRQAHILRNQTSQLTHYNNTQDQFNTNVADHGETENHTHANDTNNEHTILTSKFAL